MKKNYYQVLGINDGASLEEIKKAYKDFVKHYHPDKHGNSEFFKIRFQEVQEAYDYLITNSGSGKSYAYQKDSTHDEYTTGNDSQEKKMTQPIQIDFRRKMALAMLSVIISAVVFIVLLLGFKFKIPNPLFIPILIGVYYILSKTNLLK